MTSEEDVEVSDENIGQSRTSFLSHFRLSADDAGSGVLQEHCYAKPWSALLDSERRAKPASFLFMQRIPRLPDKETASSGDIDVVAVEPISVPYDQEKARLLMTECERNINFCRVDEIADDVWEEKVNRDGWSLSQSRLFNRVVKALHNDRLARLACAGHANEPVLRRLCIDKTAKRVRQALAGAGWDLTLSRWLHSVLVSVLGQAALAAYLDVLQTIRSKAPTQIDEMLNWTNTNPAKNVAPSVEALKVLLQRPWDPIASFMSLHQLTKLSVPVTFILVPDLPSDAPCSPAAVKRMKFWSSQLSILGKVVNVSIDTANSAADFVEAVELAVASKCAEVHTRHPERPIILLGWQVGALIACMLPYREPISAIIALGFPTKFVGGTCGDADDMLLESKVPVLFIVGQNASACSIDDLEDMRENMLAETSLVIVGSSDDRLRMSHGRKRIEGITQSMVDRCILDKISEFLNSILDTTSPDDSVDVILQHGGKPQRNTKGLSYTNRSNQFDMLAGGDTQTVLIQSSHTRDIINRRNYAKKRNHSFSGYSAELAVSEKGTPVSGISHHVMTNACSSQKPVFYSQMDAEQRDTARLGQLHHMQSATTSVLKERLKKSFLSSSLNIPAGSLSMTVDTTLNVQPTSPSVQQLLMKPSSLPSFAYQVTGADGSIPWTTDVTSTSYPPKPTSFSAGLLPSRGGQGCKFGVEAGLTQTRFEQLPTVPACALMPSGDRAPGSRTGSGSTVSYVATPVPVSSTSTRTRTIKIPKHYDM